MTQIKKISTSKTPKFLILGTMLASLILVPTVLAWNTNQKATAECNQSGIAEINVSFTNQESNRSMDVIAKDEQTGKSIDLGTFTSHETKNGILITGKSAINNGTIDFNLTWTNDKSQHDVRKAGYNAVECHGPTPTSHPSLTPTNTPTPTPTATPIPEPTFMPTLTPTPTNTPVPTTTPTTQPTEIPTNTPTPTAPPTGDTPTPTPIIITVTNNNNPDQENHNDITINNGTQVLGASTVNQLPSTGAESNILFGLISLFPAGLGLIKFAKKN